ncbi:FAD-dependent oxidoreductase [Corynebacterium riegelii]|uniref:FAD-dependent oxidoreductase n=1 Tax=Corynebacterium riegelii TaxID=156976 RepID=UPI0023F07AE9|nr:FAD-dependent oxidoreductase [Corynebacterium riegelii]
MSVPSGPTARDIEVDVLVVGSGTGLATALYADDLGLDVLVIEKSEYVGGSTSMSGGAFWAPGNHVLQREGFDDTVERGLEYVDDLVGDDAPRERWEAVIKAGPAAIKKLDELTDLNLFWAKGYSDYHPERPGGAAIGRTCEAKPFDLRKLGDERGRFHPPAIEAPFPMPATGANYKYLNLITKLPVKALPQAAWRTIQGIGGLAIGREYVATGQATAGGLFHGCVKRNIPIWTRTPMTGLLQDDAGRVTGVTASQDGKNVTIRARKGVVLAGGGFEHNMDWRQRFQSPTLKVDMTLGNDANFGDLISIAVDQVDAETSFMDQAWWFPSLAPVEADGGPKIMLAERSLPGSFMVDEHGTRFINESIDYMTFGQRTLALREEGRANDLWLIFDKAYKDSYLFASEIFPRMPFPQEWYDAGVIVEASSPEELAAKIGLPVEGFVQQMQSFNADAQAGVDTQFWRGDSLYDNYYGDPTNVPNNNLRPLSGKLYAARMVLSDLGTCGGLSANAEGTVLRNNGSPVPGLYAQGNTAANVFGTVYPGAGATIGQGLVTGWIIANHAKSA